MSCLSVGLKYRLGRAREVVLTATEALHCFFPKHIPEFFSHFLEPLPWTSKTAAGLLSVVRSVPAYCQLTACSWFNGRRMVGCQLWESNLLLPRGIWAGPCAFLPLEVAFPRRVTSCHSLPRTLQVLPLKVPRPRKSLSLGQTGVGGSGHLVPKPQLY